MSEERITLKPGDYVISEGLSENDYHAVAKAFITAGAPHGEYPDGDDYRTERGFGWNAANNYMFHGLPGSEALNGRQLTVAQVLGTAEPKQWRGPQDGLPPVGATNKQITLMTDISVGENEQEGTNYEIVAHHLGMAVVAGVTAEGRHFSYMVMAKNFRPIRTAEDVAVEAIKSAIDDSVGGFSDATLHAIATVSYAAIRDGKIPGITLTNA